MVTRSQLGGSELCDPNHKKLAQCLQQIGDELDGNVQLQRYYKYIIIWTCGKSVKYIEGGKRYCSVVISA